MKDYVKQRQREWRKLGHEIVERSGQPSVDGWEKLASFFAQGGGSVQRGGERLVS